MFLIFSAFQPHLLAPSDSDFILQSLKLRKNVSHITLPLPRLDLCWSLSLKCVSSPFYSHLSPLLPLTAVIVNAQSVVPCNLPCPSPSPVTGWLLLSLHPWFPGLSLISTPTTIYTSLLVCVETLSFHESRKCSPFDCWPPQDSPQRHTDYCKVSKCLLLSVQSATPSDLQFGTSPWNHCGFFFLCPQYLNMYVTPLPFGGHESLVHQF